MANIPQLLTKKYSRVWNRHVLANKGLDGNDGHGKNCADAAASPEKVGTSVLLRLIILGCYVLN